MGKRSRRIAIAIAVIGILFVSIFLFRAINSEIDNRRRSEQQQNAATHIEATMQCDSVCEVLVDLGDVTYGTTAQKSIRIKNLCDTSIALLDYTTTCKCTWLDLPSNAIKVGDEAEITLSFDSRGEYGSIGNFLSIKSSDERCKVVIWMSAEVE